MGNLVTLIKYSDFPLTTVLIFRRLAQLAKSNPHNAPPTISTTGAAAATTTAAPGATTAGAGPTTAAPAARVRNFLS